MPFKLRIKKGAAPIEVLTMGELAKLCNRSKDALMKLTKRGIMPESNFRKPKTLITTGINKGEYRLGYRLYSKEYIAPKIVEFFKQNVSRGKEITEDQKAELYDIFQQELEYFK